MKGFEKGSRAVMMDNHGATVGAEDMQSALAKYETLDYLCRTLFHARALGGVKTPQKKICLAQSNYPVKEFSADDKSVREDAVKFIKRAYANGLVGSGWGTLAVKDGDGIIFNADDCSPLDLSESDLVRYSDGYVSSEKKCKYLDLIIKIF